MKRSEAKELLGLPARREVSRAEVDEAYASIRATSATDDLHTVRSAWLMLRAAAAESSTITRCASCGQRNRLTADTGRAHRCGRCGAPVEAGRVQPPAPAVREAGLPASAPTTSHGETRSSTGSEPLGDSEKRSTPTTSQAPVGSDQTPSIDSAAPGGYRLLAAIASVMLFLAFFTWPYGYYTLLRWVVSSAAVGVAVIGYRETAVDQEAHAWWTWAAVPTFAAMAVMFNPFDPVEMTRQDWAIPDLVCGVVFAAATFVEFRPQPSAMQESTEQATWTYPAKGYCQFVLALVAAGVFITLAVSTPGPGGEPDCYSPLPGECR